MAYEFLKKLWGETKEGEAPKTMTADEFIAALTADKTINVVDLKAGGYVSQEKFNREKTRADGLDTQLKEANVKLESFEKDGVTIETVKKEAADWKQKYETETKALNAKLTAQERDHLIDQYLSGTEFTSSLANKGIRDLLSAEQGLTVKDGALVGADDLMKGFRKTYADAFKAADPEPKPEPKPAPAQNPLPFFSQMNPMSSPTNPAPKSKGMTLAEVMAYKNAHPDADVGALLNGNK
jgi:hypothetical protein